ncbi:MAG: MFS transporter [Alphaproteobacteria bacterium]
MWSFFENIAPKEDVTDEELEAGIPWYFKDGVASQILDSITVGPFLIAFALDLGANNIVIGLLAAIPFLTQLFQLPAIFLIERTKARKAVTLAACAIYRPMLLVMGSAAFFLGSPFALPVLVSGFAGRYILGSISACSWNSWMKDFLPEDRIGKIFANRMFKMMVASVIISLVAAWFVDAWPKMFPDYSIYRYSILLVIAFISGVYGLTCMYHMPEPKMKSAGLQKSFVSKLLMPFKDHNFKNLMIFLGTWNFAVNLAAPFFTVHMLKRLEISITLVTILTILSQISNLMIIKSWGKIADNFSNKSVLTIAAPLFIGCIFAWTFTALPEKHHFTLLLLVLIHIFTGVATAGVTLATGNISLRLAPKGEATSYLSVNSLVNNLAAGIAPVFGGLFADFFSNKELSLMVSWKSGAEGLLLQTLNFRYWDFFFLFATIIGIYSIYRLFKIKEEGDVEENIVLHELMAEIRGNMRNFRNISSVSGIKMAIHFPIEKIKIHKKKRHKKAKDESSNQ